MDNYYTEIKAGVKIIGRLGQGVLFYTDGEVSPLQLDKFKQWLEIRKKAIQISGGNSFMTTTKKAETLMRDTV